MVNILPASGTGNIALPGNDVTISFDGSTVSAAGCRLDIYSISGQTVTTGHDSVDVTSLEAGIYVVRATDSDGNTTTAKIAVK